MDFYLGDVCVAENTLENCDAPTDNNIVTDILHDGGCFSSHQGQKDGSLVEIPEEEQLTSAGSGAANVAEEVCVVVPKGSFKAQHNLKHTRR